MTPITCRFDTGADIGTAEIADLLKKGRHIVLLGEYGSGKSRCIREAFRFMSDHADADFSHPISIDLRDMWGLRRGVELISRHLSDLGLDRLNGSALRALNAGAVTLLLDGFDELGSQAWITIPPD
jgi:predicted NACHT family NTPase